MFLRTKQRCGPTKGTKRQDKLEERGRHQKTEGDEDIGGQTMQERSRKIWRPKHGTQGPTVMSWRLRCRPLPGQDHSRHANKKSPGQTAARAPSMVMPSMVQVPDTAQVLTCSTSESLKRPGPGPMDWVPSEAQKGDIWQESLSSLHQRALPTSAGFQSPTHTPVHSQGCPNHAWATLHPLELSPQCMLIFFFFLVIRPKKKKEKKIHQKPEKK